MNKHYVHQHGGMPEIDVARLGIKAGLLLDFSVNISPLGPPKEILSAWKKLAPEIEIYPNIEGDGIIRFYQERFGLSRESILAGNGSTELIYLVPRALNLKSIAVVVPSYHDYTRASQLVAAETIPLRLTEENGFRPLDCESLSNGLVRCDALFLGNPNNPTGTVFPVDTVLQLAENFPNKWILVDEAFIQFLDQYQKVSLIRKERIRSNILVFHSLTKFYALPGLRLGCVIGHPETISLLRHFKEPWTVNRIAEKVAILLIDCQGYDEELRQLIRGERVRMYDRIQRINGVRTFLPSANFFLAQWTATPDLDDLLKGLLFEGLYVRDCRNFTGLGANYFRFSVRCSKDNDRLLSSLEKSSKKYCD